MKTVLNVKGMMCEHCAARVTKKLAAMGLKDINVELSTGKVSYESSDCAESSVKEAISDLGYDVD